jgi:amidohydrolase
VSDLVTLYKDLHAHPELPFAEHRTAAIAAERLDGAGFTVFTGIGGTGVAGVLRNGDGPVVLLRADMDALPVREETGLDYASEAVATNARDERTPVMHACGHDMHVTWLCGATAALAGSQPDWSGTVIAVFQPAEEIAAGAAAMLSDGLYDRTGVPDVALGQHVFPGQAGRALYRGGPFCGAAESWDVTLHGRDGHGSRPELTDGARRIIEAEAVASGAPRPPSYETLSSFPVTVNDPVVRTSACSAPRPGHRRCSGESRGRSRERPATTPRSSPPRSSPLFPSGWRRWSPPPATC